MENLIQTRVKLFEDEILPFKSAIQGTQVKSLVSFTETFFDGFRTLGVGELYARQYERQSKLSSLSAQAKYAQKSFNKYNDWGIDRINAAIGKLKEVSKDFSDIIKPKDEKALSTSLNDFVEEFKLQCTDLEIKGRDVEKLFTAIDLISDSFQKKGVEGIVGAMDKQLKELISVRKSENRGAIDNFPVWKVIAIIIALGAAIIGFIHCNFFGCSVAAGAAYWVVIAIAAVVIRFC